MSGSIACYKACDILSTLKSFQDVEVQCFATASALKFVGKATLEALSGRAVLTDVFEEASMMDHISLNRWADLIVLCPASANSINAMAAGLGDNLPTLSYLAFDFTKPFVIVPAMNTQMYLHPRTQLSMNFLKETGVHILPTNEGLLACGESGPGRMLEPAEIIEALRNLS